MYRVYIASFFSYLSSARAIIASTARASSMFLAIEF